MKNSGSDPSKFTQVLRERKILIGVVHLQPLPGSPRYQGEGLGPIIDRARADVRTLTEAGFDAYIIENFGDAPFLSGPSPAYVLTCMARIAAELSTEGPLLTGVNVLRNDARGALAVAAAAELDFVRVNIHTGAALTDQGLITGEAAASLRERQTLAPQVAFLADIAVKHSFPLAADFDLAQAAQETAYRGLADGLIITGAATGQAASAEDLQTVSEAVPDRPLFVGSGVTASNVGKIWRVAEGVIVGTAIKYDGRVEEPVDPARAWEFAAAARKR
ncbi:MAG: BtpA/SgcQ family protein [Acidobacteriota bacterium]